MYTRWWKKLFNQQKKGSQYSLQTPSFTQESPSSTIISLVPTAEEYAHKLPDLLLASKKIAHTVLSGSHGYKRSGQGSQFWQYRLAVTGEPFHTIDWRQSAKSNKTYVRETEEENTQTLYLWCDCSGSMQWRSTESLPTKEDAALLLTISLSSLLLNGGERIQLVSPQEENKYFKGIHQLYSLAEYLLNLRSPNPVQSLPLTGQIKSHAWTVLISDFLYPYETLLIFIKQIMQRPNQILMIQITDPAERTLPYRGRLRFTGLEGENALILSNNKKSSEQYEILWSNHQKNLQQLCQNLHIPLVQHTTDSSIATTLFKLWNILSDKNHLT